MQELARKREKGRRSSRVVVEDYEDDDDYEDEDDEGEDGEGEDEQGEEEEEGSVEYADHGLSKAERKAIRERGTVAASADGVPVGDDEDADSAQWEAGGGAASLPELESIRLGRQILEKWLLEPFFARVVRGCVVRIGLQVTDGQSSPAHGTTLYRAAEVTGVKEFEEHPYMLGQRRTCKRLQLEFGESRQCYPMSSVSNHPFEELELRAWQQVLEATGRPLISANQLRCKTGELAEATHYSYSEADVTRRIEEERKERAQAGKPSTLTTRQKLLQQHAGEGGGGGGGAARPMKFQRDVLGRAIVAEHEE